MTYDPMPPPFALTNFVDPDDVSPGRWMTALSMQPWGHVPASAEAVASAFYWTGDAIEAESAVTRARADALWGLITTDEANARITSIYERQRRINQGGTP